MSTKQSDGKRIRFIQSLADDNRQFYSSPDGRGLLRHLELSFEHRWIYLFELVQNALDAGATSIRFRLEGGTALVLEHDGTSPIDEDDVEGLSKVFRSTKGASSVGFMGIGFKSVFGRFLEACVSGWGWTFRYEIPQMIGATYGDVQPDLLGAVIPIWDPDIASPNSGFTTRFELRQLTDPGADLKSDLTYFLPDDERTLLAILAHAGLERFQIDENTWELGAEEQVDGSVEAVAVSASETLLWQLFPVPFKPSREATARFLEHRKIIPSEDEREEAYAQATRERTVVGVLPLNEDGVPAPPKRGRVYATLPTEVTLPFGLHINADWLLNISRTGLREIEENRWQHEIVLCIADVVGSLLTWVRSACLEPTQAQAAFTALAVPSREEGHRLDALLLQDSWLTRLRERLRGKAVVPVWNEEGSDVAFADPEKAIDPPSALAGAFEDDPRLAPSVLLKGMVLHRRLLGPGARNLLALAGLLEESTPDLLEEIWKEGLEYWWEELPLDDADARDVLFRLWGAVAELESDFNWRHAELPCVRTVQGHWRTIDRTTFFNEALPSDNEPGGAETRDLIEEFLPDLGSCISDRWIAALRQAAGRENDFGRLSRARSWLERHSHATELHPAIESAVRALASSSNPDWSVLVPLGTWAMHRRPRGDLLTHVLVEVDGGFEGVSASEALVADPYVERGESRRQLFPNLPAISAAYLQQDPPTADAHEWRQFFRAAGAKGSLVVQTISKHVGSREPDKVAKFLGCPRERIGKANRAGYKLLDFRIAPALPDKHAPEDVRAALAPWLEDGFSGFRGKGRRRTTYMYHTEHPILGERLSSWVRRLAALEWVPTEEGRLMLPEDVLPRPDPARPDAPVAQLSSALLSVLEEEGLIFGAAVPEAPALRRLAAVGSELGGAELAEVLKEVRQSSRDQDRRGFQKIVRQLLIPAADGRRVRIDRIVHRVGGRLRGSLGGWVLSLAELPVQLRAELLQPEFPYEFPNNTTGAQALDFLEDVWCRARIAASGLANEVRDVLPVAYAYCLEDVAEDDSLAERWEALLPQAAVFADRDWVPLDEAQASVNFDDLKDHRFLPREANLRLATSGHLGTSFEQQLRTANALRLPLLSSIVNREWKEAGLAQGADWTAKFELIFDLLDRVKGSGSDDQQDSSVKRIRRLRHVAGLELKLAISEVVQKIRIHARTEDGVLIIAGKPIEFAADAAKELLRSHGFSQRGDLAADLTGILASLGEDESFALALRKFVDSFAPGFAIPSEFDLEAGLGSSTFDGGSGKTSAATSPSGATERARKRRETRDGSRDVKDPPDPSYDRGRALALQKALAEQLRKALKGEIKPEEPVEEPAEGEEGGGGALGDEMYRQVAAQYERESGRTPEIGRPRQTGWDLRSVDPLTGAVRLIEVKGRGRAWTGEEVIELSRAQARAALRALEAGDGTKWYLYVVEHGSDGSFRVLPVPNPLQVANRWIMAGGAWRMVAEEPATFKPNPRAVET